MVTFIKRKENDIIVRCKQCNRPCEELENDSYLSFIERFHYSREEHPQSIRKFACFACKKILHQWENKTFTEKDFLFDGYIKCLHCGKYIHIIKYFEQSNSSIKCPSCENFNFLKYEYMKEKIYEKVK